MSSFNELEKDIVRGSLLTLYQLNNEDLYSVSFCVNLIGQEGITCIDTLDDATERKLSSMFPNIRNYVGFHAFYFQAKYDLKSEKFYSSIMRKKFGSEDSVFESLTGESSSLIGSFFDLEKEILNFSQKERIFQKRKAC